MPLLWVATKSPWPPVDGGRLLLWESLGALAAAEIEVDLVAPVAAGAAERAAMEARLGERCRPFLVAARPRPKASAAARSLLRGEPISIARHSLAPVAAEVERRLAGGGYEAVVAEQLQAWPQTAAARRAGLPRLLRAQNVESDLWRAAATHQSGLARELARREAAQLARREGAAVRDAALTLALSSADAAALARLGGSGAAVEWLPPPFPAELPRASQRLPGEPAVVLFGSAGWLPNDDAERWFLGEVWPAVARSLPAARLHRFGGRADSGGQALAGTEGHPAPGESREAFASGALLVLPLRIASGVRLRVLEAWARGTPVVGTAAALSGLSGGHDDAWLRAETPAEFASAIERLASERGLAGQLVAAGRERLRRDHDPARFAARFVELIGRLRSRS